MLTNATEEHRIKADLALIPDGEYYVSQNYKNFGKIEAKMRVENGSFIVLKGSICCPSDKEWKPEALRNANIKDNVLQEDAVANSPSTAGWIVFGCANNGWLVWKDKNGNLIDTYRKSNYAVNSDNNGK